LHVKVHPERPGHCAYFLFNPKEGPCCFGTSVEWSLMEARHIAEIAQAMDALSCRPRVSKGDRNAAERVLKRAPYHPELRDEALRKWMSLGVTHPGRRRHSYTNVECEPLVAIH